MSLLNHIGVIADRPILPPLDAGDPATFAMTDFRNSPMITTSPQTSIEDALQTMKVAGVRFLFVADERGRLVGSVTSFHIQGERPLQHMMAVGCTPTSCAWRDVLVGEVMDPTEAWRTIDVAVVGAARLGDLAALADEPERRYLVVVEPAADGRGPQVRGLISATRVGKLLGQRAATAAAGSGRGPS
jgi:CBS-domain-containing membrane protein